MDHPDDFYVSEPKSERDVFRDELVPLKRCDSLLDDTYWSADTTIKYCPVFNSQDFIYGDYYSSKASWYRLAVHTCDIEERKALNKTCKPKEEIEHYIQNTIMALDFVTEKPGILNFEKKRPLFRELKNMKWSVNP